MLSSLRTPLEDNDCTRVTAYLLKARAFVLASWPANVEQQRRLEDNGDMQGYKNGPCRMALDFFVPLFSVEAQFLGQLFPVKQGQGSRILHKQRSSLSSPFKWSARLGITRRPPAAAKASPAPPPPPPAGTPCAGYVPYVKCDAGGNILSM